MERVNILGSKINVININELLIQLNKLIASKKSHYICVTNVHTVTTGISNKSFRDITNNSSLSIPDGMPLVWIAKNRGYRNIEKCSGPDIMLEIFRISEQKGYSNYFYGSTEDTLNKMKKNLLNKFPKLNIIGMDSPPYRELSKEEDEEVISKINALKPNIIWIGLGAPKQEIWMQNHVNKINSSVIFGVGAAFDFHAGTLKRAPLWMQNHGLEWLYRFIKEPRRLWKRYLLINLKFIVCLIFFRKKLEC